MRRHAGACKIALGSQLGRSLWHGCQNEKTKQRRDLMIRSILSTTDVSITAHRGGGTAYVEPSRSRVRPVLPSTRL